MLVTMKELLMHAKEEQYAIPAPNVFNKESVAVCFEACVEQHSPIILDIGYAMGIEETAEIALSYGKRYPSVPFALNLDHGGPFEHIIKAIRSGYSSVMIDRSTLLLEDNIREVKEIVRIAHGVGVSVEAELGHVGQGIEYEKTRDSGLTDVTQAKYFVEQTGVDCLAVAVGTSHGLYKGVPHLEFELLDALHNELSIPLVLHGGSGTGDKNLQRAVKTGIQKVNLYTDLGEAWISKLREELQLYDCTKEEITQDEFKNQKKKITQLLYDSCQNGYKQKLIHYMKLFDSINRY